MTQVSFTKAGASTETHTYEYDGGVAGAPNAKGHLTKLTDTAGITNWTYEAHGRVQSKSQTVGTTTLLVTYGYNAAGQLQTVTTPSGQQIGYTYLNNRVSGITLNGQPLITSATTEPFGPLSVWQWANAHYSYRDFDLDGRVAAWEHRNGVSILRNDLTIDVASRVSQISDPANAALLSVYGYDNLDHLTSDQKGSPLSSTLQYNYDAVGNRQTYQVDASSTTLTNQSGSNRLDRMVGAVDPTYLAGANSVVFTYNNANRLVQVQADGATVATYLVNGLGQRVQKSAGGVATQFLYDEAGHLLGEYDGSGNLVQETIWLEDLPIATLRPTGTGTPTPVATYYVHPDHLGTPRAITRPSDSAFVWRWDNTDPFGANAPNENPAGLGAFKYNLRFPGQYFDVETGLNYNYFRDYDPSLGRYVESDPIGLRAGINTYSYGWANPNSFTDPTGRFVIVPIIIALIGGADAATTIGGLAAISGAAWWVSHQGDGSGSTGGGSGGTSGGSSDGGGRAGNSGSGNVVPFPAPGNAPVWPQDTDDVPFGIGRICVLMGETWSHCIYDCPGIPYEIHRPRPKGSCGKEGECPRTIAFPN